MNGAVLLAGGFGTRFDGEEKAIACVAGTPMIRRVADAIAPVVDDLVVNARPEQRDTIAAALDGLEVSYRFAFDDVPDRGPLAGIETGLDESEATYTLVVACDMPFVATDFVEVLFDRACGMDAAVPVERDVDGSWLQPLQAVYHTDAMGRATAQALDDGIDSPAAVVERLEYDRVVVSETDARRASWTLRNVNTREDLHEAERRLHQSVTRRS